MYTNKKPLTKSEKVKITVFLGLLVIGLGISMTSNTTEEVALDYKTPAFSELQVSTGIVSFTPQPRNNSNELVLTMYKNKEVNMKLHFICDQPGSQNVANCHMRHTATESINFKKHVNGKEATVWWAEIPATGERRLYQLESGGVKFLTYEEQAKKYQQYVDKLIAREKKINDIRKG